MALKQDQTLWAWGLNGNGQLGDNTLVDKLVPTQESTAATDWVAIAAGLAHSVALKSDGSLWTWGSNSDGQLGDNTIVSKSSPTQEFTSATDWVAVAAGSNHTLALKSDGTLWAWGLNGSGQLGDNSVTQRNAPTQENTAATDWVAIAAGSAQSFAIKSPGTLWGWGENAGGRLGDGTVTQRNVPTQEFTGATNWAYAASGLHGAAIRSDGTLYGWGPNTNGEVGDGTLTQRNAPVQENSAATDWGP